jgi:imidazole glycerol phosphate synthase subunit HisF
VGWGGGGNVCAARLAEWVEVASLGGQYDRAGEGWELGQLEIVGEVDRDVEVPLMASEGGVDAAIVHLSGVFVEGEVDVQKLATLAPGNGCGAAQVRPR